MVQKELIKVGYARVAYLYADYTYTKELQTLEEKAKNNKKGIWSDENIISKMDSDSESNNGDISENDKTVSIWDEIFDLISKLIDKIFELFENML